MQDPEQSEPDAPPEARYDLHRWIRLRGAAVLAGCLAVLLLAGLATPSLRGYGTHTGLGLPPCGFLQRTGYPCPSCGMTTAFAAMIRGRVNLAWRANPFGIVLFVLTVLGAVGGGVELRTGRSVLQRIGFRPWWCWALLAAWLAAWGVQLWLGRLAGRYPIF